MHSMETDATPSMQSEAQGPLLGLVLAGEARTGINADRMQELAAQVAQQHAERGITGHAYYQDGRLIQYLEGTPEAIEQILSELESGESFTLRHLVRTEDLRQRRFTTWELDACSDAELMDLRLEHVLEALLQNFATTLFGQDSTQAAIWRLVDAIARRRENAGKPKARNTRLVLAH